MQTENDTQSKFIADVTSLLQRTNSTQKTIAELLGITEGYLSALLNRKRSPSAHLRKLVDMKLLALTPAAVKPVEPTNARIVDHLDNWRKVPVVSWAHAGESVDYEDLCRHLEEWIETDSKDPNALALIVEGDSMEPMFHAGDRIVVSPNQEPRNGCYAVARLAEGGVTLKKFYRTGPQGSRIRLEPLNPQYEPKECPAEAFSWIYPVMSRVTKLWI